MAVGRFRYSPWRGGPDPLAPPYDVRAALDEVGRDVLAGGSLGEALRELLRRGCIRIDLQRDVEVPAGGLRISACGAEERERDQRTSPRPPAEQIFLDLATLGERRFALVLATGNRDAEPDPREVRFVVGMPRVVATRSSEVTHRAMGIALRE